jgi:chromosome segregation ATPase
MGRKKRSIEVNSEGLSPPSKMNKNDTEAIMAKLDSLESRFSKVEQEVAELTRIVRSFEDTFEGIKADVESLKESQDCFRRLEIESKKRCVLIRGLKFRSKGKFETRTETREALADFFNQVGVDPPHLVDYQRLGGLRAGEDGGKVAIRAEFSDVDQRINLFDKLKLKGRELQDYSVQTDYPKFQLQEFKLLSGQAYEIRKARPGIKTRIIPKGLGLVLQTKNGPESKWMAVSAGQGN